MRLQISIGALSLSLLSGLFLSACADTTTSETQRGLQSLSASRGDITRVVGATGKIVPREEIMVGSEVSGRVMEVLVDFNSEVRAGDVLAKIDPTNFLSRVQQINSRIESAQADIDVQKASVESARVSLQASELQLARRRDLYKQEAISQAQLESSERDVGVGRASLKVSEARVISSQASLRQLRAQFAEARADLARTTITAPIDGIIIDRKIDPGQTVQASFTAPELFAIAADLSQIQVEAGVVESEVAGLEAGDTARFTVDAYPDATIVGVVEQLRLKSTEANNIVSYTAVIGAENPGNRLMPGMTANLQIITEIKPGAQRLPVTVERFRPSPEDIADFGADVDNAEKGDLLEPTMVRLRGIGLPSTRVASFRAQLEPATQRMRETINDPTMSWRHTPMRIALNELIEAQVSKFLNADEQQAYAAQVAQERSVRPVELWVETGDGKMVQRTVKLGLSDGSFVEVLDGLDDDDRVVTGFVELDADGNPVRGGRHGGGRPGGRRG